MNAQLNSTYLLDSYSYPFDEKMVATQPAEPRDHSRLMTINRNSQKIDVSHHFYDLPTLLKPGDVIVRNNSKVINASVSAKKTTGGQVNLLLIKQILTASTATECVWQVICKPGLKIGQQVMLSAKIMATCIEIDGYTRHLRFNVNVQTLLNWLEINGDIPLPPYIAKLIANQATSKEKDSLISRYQTTYAQVSGSAAAPTAGLHFTPELDEKLLANNIQIVEITLHVGLGTFLPVKTNNILDHSMHSEWYEISAPACQQLNLARKSGQRLVAVGTTSTRVLESAINENGVFNPQTSETDIFIYPGYKFKAVNALITNFHLPKSTLLMLISAFASYPNSPQEFVNFPTSLIGQAYQQAIGDNWRFYSLGDAMLIE